MKAIKTLFFAAMAILAIGAVSCKKEKTDSKTEPTTSVSPIDSILSAAGDGQVIELNVDSVLLSDTKVETTTVVCFIAENAPTCAPLKEPLTKLAEENNDKVTVITVDVTACPKTATSFGLDAESPLVPCVVVLFPNGESQTYHDLSSFITPDLEKKSADEQAEGIYANLLNYAGLTETND